LVEINYFDGGFVKLDEIFFEAFIVSLTNVKKANCINLLIFASHNLVN
jgi:hypothetical protein